MQWIEFNEVPGLELHYPLFFQKAYSEYERINGSHVKIFTDGKSFLPVKIKIGKFIKQAQYLYPPLKTGVRLTTEEEQSFLEKFIFFCKQQSVCDFITPPFHYSVFNAIPYGSFYTDLGIIVINLEKNEEDLFKSFSNNYRNEIRKSLLENIEIKFDNSAFPDFYKLYKSTHQRQGIYFDTEAHLKSLVDCLGKKNCQIAVSRRGNEIYSAALIAYNANEGYYFQSGTVENCAYPGAGKLLQLEVIKELKKLGVKRYIMGGFRLGDISGTKYDGIQKYKMRFGAEIEKGFHFCTKITWRYTVYKKLLNWYLKLKGIKQNTSGLNYLYN